MADSLHRVIIKADSQTVYRALTEQTGIQGWWTDTCESPRNEGGLYRCWFDNYKTLFTFEARKLLPNKRVFWLCIDGPPEWVNTQLWWEINALDSHHCEVDFKHMNWRRDDGLFPLCNSTWGTLMQQLKSHCESGEAHPWFRNHKLTA